MPDVDVFEKEDKVIVRADLPEIEAEDVDVSIVENVLRIKGERKHGEEVKDESYFMTERRFGSFERAIELPVPVRSEDVQATYKEGVLEIALPKAEVKKAKEIRIKVA
jgi:HSP20 family protein